MATTSGRKQRGKQAVCYRNWKDTPREIKEEPKEVTKVEDDVPKEHKSALKKTEDYSKTIHMSKQGIYDQLTSKHGEKFTDDEAQYTIDNMKADFNENALKKQKVIRNQ